MSPHWARNTLPAPGDGQNSVLGPELRILQQQALRSAIQTHSAWIWIRKVAGLTGIATPKYCTSVVYPMCNKTRPVCVSPSMALTSGKFPFYVLLVFFPGEKVRRQKLCNADTLLMSPQWTHDSPWAPGYSHSRSERSTGHHGASQCTWTRGGDAVQPLRQRVFLETFTNKKS